MSFKLFLNVALKMYIEEIAKVQQKFGYFINKTQNVVLRVFFQFIPIDSSEGA